MTETSGSILLRAKRPARTIDLTQIDRKGRDYDPSEWFVVPRDVIDRAVAMIMSGEIVDYSYDKAQQKLVRLAK